MELCIDISYLESSHYDDKLFPVYSSRSGHVFLMLRMQEFKLVQASISSLQSVYLAVVTQLKRQQLNITKRITTVASSFDPRLTFSVDIAKCSRIKSMSFTLEVGQVTLHCTSSTSD